MNLFETDLNYGNESISLAIPILKKEFPDIIEIKRLDKGAIADREISVDLLVKYIDRDETWAVKSRRPEYSHFDDVTIELMNGTGERGDYYRFKGGIVKKYVYFWRTNGTIIKLLVLNAKKLAEIPTEYWKGNLMTSFPGVERITCFKNNIRGAAYFTAIDKDILDKFGVIEKTFIATDKNQKKLEEYK